MISFNFFGHPNILSTHRNTIEFTRDNELSKKGDCILGVNSDFKHEDLMKLIHSSSNLKMIINVGDYREEIIFIPNKQFDDNEEIVIRRSEFPSKRTFGIRADKSASDIDRRIVELLKNPGTKGTVEIAGVK
jgi:uncharacterized protein